MPNMELVKDTRRDERGSHYEPCGQMSDPPERGALNEVLSASLSKPQYFRYYKEIMECVRVKCYKGSERLLNPVLGL